MKPKTFRAAECDHHRPVVKTADGWRHIYDGSLGGPCTAGVYWVNATYEGEHFLSQLAIRVPDPVVIRTVIPDEDDPAPDVGPDPVVLPRAAVCNNWERWTEDE